jgi:hypothetical protein
MREKRWSATICDLSQGGLALHLQRRYEKGAALAVELPGDGAREPSMVFVKVVHVKRLADGGWKLGCRFISELSDDDVHRLVAPAPEPIPAKTSYANVRVTVEDFSGASFQLTIKQLNIAKSHRVITGEQLRIAGGQNKWSFQLEVDYLKSQGDHWTLHGFLVQPTTVAELRHGIKHSPSRARSAAE